MPARRSARTVVVVCIALTATALSACERPPTLTAPGPVHASRPVDVSVYGDSLTPTPDYVSQGQASGYRVVGHTAGGSHMCGVGETPATGDQRNWVKVLDDIRHGVDAIILQYQGWQNYTMSCGGRMDAFPYATWKDSDPSKKWRVYLDTFREEIERQGNRTHLFVVLAVPSPSDMPHWVVPQQVTDHGARVMAYRHPEQITTISVRDLFADSRGQWVPTAPCIDQERSAGLCGSDGRVRLRHADRIHHACPGSSALVCDRPSPAGMRYRLRVFDAMNRHYAHPR